MTASRTAESSAIMGFSLSGRGVILPSVSEAVTLAVMRKTADRQAWSAFIRGGSGGLRAAWSTAVHSIRMGRERRCWADGRV